MRHKFALLAALVAGLLPVAALAQASPELPASPSQTPAAASAAAADQAPPKLPPPSAFPAKIAIVEFEQAVIATNEGQRTLNDIQKKYQPKQTQLEGLNSEIETLKKQLQAAPATTTDADRAARMKTLDTKQKQLDRETDDAKTAYQTDLQEAYSKVAAKVHDTMLKYVKDNGYTILLDVSNQQSSQVMWISETQNSDITEAVVNAYNTSSGVAAPAAPAAATHSKPAATTTPHTAAPHTTTTPHPAAKPPAQ